MNTPHFIHPKPPSPVSRSGVRKLAEAVFRTAFLSGMLLLSGCRAAAPDITQTSAAPTQEYERYTEDSVREQNAFSDFTEELFAEEASSSLLSLHYTLDDPEAYGITEADSAFGEGTLESLRESTAQTRRIRDELHSFDVSLLDDDQKMTWTVLADYLDTALMGEGLELYSRPIAPTIGIQAQLPILLSEYTFHDKDDVTDYFYLLSQIDVYYKELGEFEKEKAAAGLGFSDGTLDRIIDSCRSYLFIPQDNFLTETFEEKLAGLTDATDEEKSAWKGEHVRLLTEHFLPAYQSLIETLSSLKGSGVNEIGMCGYPQGQEYYEYLVRSATGTSYESVDDLTDAVTARIEEDAAEAASLLNPELYEEMLTASFRETDANAILKDLQIRIQEDFPALPACSYEVKDVPEALELSLSPAFYLVPPLDRYEDNVIYINRNEQYASSPLYTTLAHEGFPGHLYQTVYFSSVCTDPLRRILSFPAYTEGWATYVEFQSYFFDNGLSPDLQSLQMHNQAVVLGIHALLDLNINYYGWTRDQTAAFLEETYGISDRETSDRMYDLMVDNPSNYLEYYVGWLEIQTMREEAEETLGDSFQAKDFHTFLLETGPASFPVIRSYFRTWLVTAPLSKAAA